MTDPYPIRAIPCSHEGCSESLKGHAWSQIKSNWFFQKNGQSWCPTHIPEWVLEWREKKED